MRDDLQTRRKRLATIDVISWTEDYPKGNTQCYAAIELWLEGQLEDAIIFGPCSSEDDAWDEAIAASGDLLNAFKEENDDI